MDKTKPFGLIIPKKSQSVKPTTSAIFDSDSDDEPVVKNKKKMPAIPQAKPIKTAPTEDPSIYEYDSIYDDMKAQEVAKIAPKDVNKPSRYIESLLKAADKRKKDQERRVEKKVHHEREKEGDKFKDKEAFVTSAYKKKMQEMEEEEERERRENMLNEMMDVTKQKDLSGFYRHFLNQSIGAEAIPVFGERYVKTEIKEERVSDAEDEKKDGHGKASGKDAVGDMKKMKSKSRIEDADRDTESESDAEVARKDGEGRTTKNYRKDAVGDVRKTMMKSKSRIEDADRDSESDEEVVKKDAVKVQQVGGKMLESELMDEDVDRDTDMESSSDGEGVGKDAVKDWRVKEPMSKRKSTSKDNVDRDSDDDKSKDVKNKNDDRRASKRDAFKESFVKKLKNIKDNVDRDLRSDSSNAEYKKPNDSKRGSSKEHKVKILKTTSAPDVDRDYSSDDGSFKKDISKGGQLKVKTLLDKDLDKDLSGDSSSDGEAQNVSSVNDKGGKKAKDSFGKGRQFRKSRLDENADRDSHSDSSDDDEVPIKDTTSKMGDRKITKKNTSRKISRNDGDSDSAGEKERSSRKSTDIDKSTKRKRSPEKSNKRNTKKKTEDDESGSDENGESSKENGDKLLKVAEPKKTREDIFKKRTVGEVFADAQARYFQRMAARAS